MPHKIGCVYKTPFHKFSHKKIYIATSLSLQVLYFTQRMESLTISAFMGSQQVTTTPVNSYKKDKGGVASPDVPIAILLNKIASETDGAKKALLEQQLSDELKVYMAVNQLTNHFIVTAYVCICFSSAKIYNQRCILLQLNWPLRRST